MQWSDEGYLISKSNFDENSIIVEAFTLKHGKYTGIVYGGSSRKQKRNFQIGNKILFHWKSKNENATGYFNFELIEPISAFFFDDKRKSICLMAASSILKILLPERQINEKIYLSFKKMLNDLKLEHWITYYINWELSLIKELGYEINIHNFDNKNYKIPKLFKSFEKYKDSRSEIKNALLFNKNLLNENFIIPNKLKLPLSRNILENYYN